MAEDPWDTILEQEEDLAEDDIERFRLFYHGAVEPHSTVDAALRRGAVAGFLAIEVPIAVGSAYAAVKQQDPDLLYWALVGAPAAGGGAVVGSGYAAGNAIDRVKRYDEVLLDHGEDLRDAYGPPTYTGFLPRSTLE